MVRPRIRRAPRAGSLASARTPAELLSKLYLQRGLAETEAAAPGLASLHPASSLLGIDQAVALLTDHLRRGSHLLVVADYDADGATGGATAVRGLRALGARRVSYLVPSRFAFGYGLSPAVVDAATHHQPDLLITVDNGIASLSGVAHARSLGIPVLVTDHHLPGPRLPAAAAILNPNQPDCAFPSKHLAGVGVIFYLLMATRAALRAEGWFGAMRPEPNLADLLDLVALGTVADVVTLDRNNRILVEQGLRRIRAGRCSAGVLALLRIAGRDPRRATANDLAFHVGPRLNAAGRIQDMSVGVECLLAEDPEHAMTLARSLDTMNRTRREIEVAMRDQAEAHLDALALDGTHLPCGLCLFGADWHQGVSGILAARIRERHHRPVVVFAPGGDGMLRGSARSIPGVHMRDLIARVDHQHPGLIERFGGHAMAAGLSLRAVALPAFESAFDAAVRELLGDHPPTPEICSDGALPAHLMTLETAEAVRVAGPWGKDFAEPRFDGTFEVLEARVVGERHLKLRLAAPIDQGETAAPNPGPIDAIGFHLGDQHSEAVGAVHLAYRLDVNTYRGAHSAQFILEHLEPTPT
ncbi:single-stranded-DNA-specific exonuclease RecJ [Thiocapsa imhoffii]|uniref:Single-stranded-DNA-specific exonuclease RecJ n=1 Tax=Thiocapsa imhoffii TaxID=382777 RepID=A0A9X0WF64_9GAMM|nr:single-stranded-DNA-specific exonuclease RecJ [Thiocapsa imhoffii]MBK1643576.1 single-stranded-DNA-specific exonuclease RecJ [Thiocapsa imhoffii]